MPHGAHDVVDKLSKIFTKAVSVSLFIALFFILQYILDMKFQCSCRPGLHLNGVLYMVLPPIFLTWVLVYIESFNQRRICNIWRRTCNNILSCILQMLFKLLTVSAVWITAVLFDGDWYFCYKTNMNSNYTGMPCRDENSLADEDKLVRNGFRIDSLEYGMYLIGVVLALWTMIEGLRVCCSRIKGLNGDWNCELLCCPPYYRVVYEKLLEEQVSQHLKEKLTALAAERAQVICEPYIQDIQDHENCDNTGKVWDSWHKISASDFYLEKNPPEPPLMDPENVPEPVP